MTPLAAAAALIGSLPADRRILVGIAGAPGAGKSTFATQLAADVDGMVLPMDGFHLPQLRLVELGRRERMGAPDTFDVDGFVTLLGSLRPAFGKPGQRVPAPGFDRTAEEPEPGAIPIDARHRILLIEGNYLLHDADGWERVAPLLDATLFVHLDHVTRHDRLIARHIAFGKTPVAAREWALGTDERNAVLIAAGSARADLLLELD
jgi:pantothenate kinase